MTKSKDWLSRNQNNVSECGDMAISGLLFQWTSTIKNATKRVDIVQSGAQYHLIENKLVLSMLLLINCWVDVKQQLLSHLTIFPSSFKPNCCVFRKLVSSKVKLHMKNHLVWLIILVLLLKSDFVIAICNQVNRTSYHYNCTVVKLTMWLHYDTL